ncbi:MAG: hypothetical protein KTR31_09175 [Myxococcales bacterium]|nr:hypothetical protein [Myxococcales bacterium]
MTRWLVVLAVAGGCVVGGGEGYWEFDDPRLVSVRIGSGDITVDSTSGDVMVLEWDGGGFGDNARPDVQEAGGEVRVDANGGVLGGGSVTLDVPHGVALDLTVERGSIDVTLDAPANVFACVAAGSVSLGVPAGGYVLDVGLIATVDSDVYHDPDAEHTLHACSAAGSVEVFATTSGEG